MFNRNMSYLKKRIAPFLLATFFFVGCNDTQSQKSDLTDPDSAVVVPTLGLPKPSAEILATLGPENDVSTQYLLPDPLFVVVGKPKQFLASSVGIGNDWLATRVIETSLRLAYIDPSDIEFFVQSSGLPLGVPVMVPSPDPSMPPRQQIFPIARRSIVIALEKPFDSSAFLTAILGHEENPALRKRAEGQTEYYDITPKGVLPQQHSAFRQIDERTIVLAEGIEEDIKSIFSGTAPQNAIFDRLKHTPLDVNELTILMSLEDLPVTPEMWDSMVEGLGQAGRIPPSFIPLFKQHLRALTLSLDVEAGNGKPVASLYVEGRDEKSGGVIKEAIQGLIVSRQTSLAVMNEEAKKMLPIPADFAMSLLNAISVTGEGTRVYVAVNYFDALLPTITEGIQRYQSLAQQEELQSRRFEAMQILLGIHAKYYGENKRFPADITDADGKPLLSWRVALLPVMAKLFPQMGLGELYEKFKLDEPWDSEVNKELLGSMPGIFNSWSDDVESSKTIYRFFDSPGTPFSNRDMKIEEMPNPAATLMFVQVLPEQAVEWTKPVPLDFDVDSLADLVGNTLFGITFAGQPVGAPVISSTAPNYENWKRQIEMLIKGPVVPPNVEIPFQPKATE